MFKKRFPILLVGSFFLLGHVMASTGEEGSLSSVKSPLAIPSESNPEASNLSASVKAMMRKGTSLTSGNFKEVLDVPALTQVPNLRVKFQSLIPNPPYNLQQIRELRAVDGVFAKEFDNAIVNQMNPDNKYLLVHSICDTSNTRLLSMYFSREDVEKLSSTEKRNLSISIIFELRNLLSTSVAHKDYFRSWYDTGFYIETPAEYLFDISQTDARVPMEKTICEQSEFREVILRDIYKRSEVFPLEDPIAIGVQHWEQQFNNRILIKPNWQDMKNAAIYNPDNHSLFYKKNENVGMQGLGNEVATFINLEKEDKSIDSIKIVGGFARLQAGVTIPEEDDGSYRWYVREVMKKAGLPFDVYYK